MTSKDSAKIQRNIVYNVLRFPPKILAYLPSIENETMALFHFEQKTDPLATKRRYYDRVLRNVLTGAVLLLGFLMLGILGYHLTCGFSWIDSLLNASMILSGMGPTNPIQTDAGKWFASFYALFSGVVFISTIGIIIAPVVHRAFHKFHLDNE